MKRFLALFCLFILNISLSHAALTINFVESGGDVVATSSGSVNTMGLTLESGTTGASTSFVRSFLSLGYSELFFGQMPMAVGNVRYSGVNTDIIFITGDNKINADSSSGDVVSLISQDSLDLLSLPSSYVSNDPISGGAVWAGQTLAGMGLIPGTYVISWGSDETADSLTLNIGSVDSTAPTLLSSTPADNATGVSTDPPTLSLVFDEPVSYASGLIRMYRTSDDVEINNRSVSGSTGSGTPNISISFENALAIETEYYVLIPAGAFEDAVGNPYAGISSTTTLSFSTGAPAPTYTVEGTVSNLAALGLVLQNNAGDDLDIFTNGNFLFSESLADGSAYDVTVLTNPPGQTCNVTNGSGEIATANITDVLVDCVDDVVPTYSVGGTVSGLTGTGLALQNNGADTLPIAANGPFTFVMDLVDTTAYAVTVSTQPTGQSCSVTNGNGAIAAADVTNVGVTCEDDVVPPVEPPPPATPIPTTSQWALIMLSMLLGLIVFSNRRRLF